MLVSREHNELQRLLRSASGQDFFDCFPLIAVHIESSAILSILREWADTHLSSVTHSLGCEFSLLAFGSLGRLEFVRNHSDFDPIIIIDGEITPTLANSIRSAVLTPLARDNPWLLFDDRPKVLLGEWDPVSAELRYPVMTVDQLLKSSEGIDRQRRWQICLEARPVYNQQLFHSVRQRLVPLSNRSVSLADGSEGETRPNFRELIRTAPAFYSAFENPKFLYKNAAKYWKSRFLREFFAFSTQLSLLHGWCLDKDGEVVDDSQIRAATLVKIIRADNFAQVLDREARRNPELNRRVIKELGAILKEHSIDSDSFSRFGRDFDTDAARLLHGLLVHLLVRFTECWGKLYDPQVKAALQSIPEEAINFDATFRSEIADENAAMIVQELMTLRNRYRAFMAATSQAIKFIFVERRTWRTESLPMEVAQALAPFASCQNHPM